MERTSKELFWGFGLIERMGDDNTTKKVYVEKCMGSRLVGQPGRDGFVPWITVWKKKVQVLGKQGGWCMIK